MTLTALKSAIQGFGRMPTPLPSWGQNYCLTFFLWFGRGYGFGGGEGESGGDPRGELSGPWHPIKGACWQPLIMEVSSDHRAKVVGARFSHHTLPLLLPSILTQWQSVTECSHSGWGVKLRPLEGRGVYLNRLGILLYGRAVSTPIYLPHHLIYIGAGSQIFILCFGL